MHIPIQPIFALSLASLVATASGSSSTVEPSIVRIQVTSTITVTPNQAVPTLEALQRRQWEWTPSAPAWTPSAPAWTESAPAWTRPAWVPTPSPLASTPPTIATTIPLSASPSYTYEETHRDNKKDTLAHGIIAAVIFGLLCLVGFVGCAITWCCRWGRARKGVLDVEADASTAQLAGSHSIDGFTLTPMQSSESVKMPKPVHYFETQPHVLRPPKEVRIERTDWSRA